MMDYGKIMWQALESADLDDANKEKFKELEKKSDEVGDLRRSISERVYNY